MSQSFRLILPDQKRLRTAFDAVLDQAGFVFSKETSRAANGYTVDTTKALPPIETYEFRSEAALEWLADGAADLAIIGEDTFLEMKAKGALDVDAQPRSILSMNRIAACSMWIASKPEVQINDLKDLESLRIATSYPGLLQQILDKQGVTPARIIAQKGGVESTITAGRADAILEIVETGESLKQNGLVKKLPVFDSCAQLVRVGATQNFAHEGLIAAFNARVQRALTVMDAKNTLATADKATFTAPREAKASLPMVPQRAYWQPEFTN